QVGTIGILYVLEHIGSESVVVRAHIGIGQALACCAVARIEFDRVGKFQDCLGVIQVVEVGLPHRDMVSGGAAPPQQVDQHASRQRQQHQRCAEDGGKAKAFDLFHTSSPFPLLLDQFDLITVCLKQI